MYLKMYLSHIAMHKQKQGEIEAKHLHFSFNVFTLNDLQLVGVCWMVGFYQVVSQFLED